MPEIDLNTAQFDTPHPAGGTIIDLNNAQFDAANQNYGPPPPPNLMQKITQNLNQAGQQSTQDQNNYGPILGPINAAGDVAGAIGKSGVDTFKSLFPGAAQDIESVVKPVVGAVANTSPDNISNFFGGGQIGMPNTIGQDLSATAQAYPKAAHTLGNFANIAGAVAPAGKIVDAVIDGTPNAIKIAGNALLDAADNELPPVPPGPALTREQQTAALRKSASNNYKNSADQDIAFSNQDSQNLDAALSKLQPKTDLETRVWSSSPAAAHVQDIQDSLATEDPTLNGMLAKRSQINSEINVANRQKNSALAGQLGQVKDAMDETMMNGDTGTWQQANHEWAQQAILGDTDELVNRAATKNQPANSLDTAINNYLLSYKGKSLSDAEFSALKNVADNSSFDTLKRGAASGLTKFAATSVGAHFGPVGAAAGYLMGHYGSEFLKDAAMTAKLAKLDEFRDLILSRKPPSTYPVSTHVFEPPVNIVQRMKINGAKK